MWKNRSFYGYVQLRYVKSTKHKYMTQDKEQAW